MKRKINNHLLYVSLALVLLGCVCCLVGAISGSVYIKTKGTPSDNINHLFTSVLEGDGNACTLYSDSYEQIDFDVPENEDETVSTICRALTQSYSWNPVSADPDEEHSLTASNMVRFSYLDLNKMSEDISSKIDTYVFDTVMEYDTNVTTSNGKYIPEIYEKAYSQALFEALREPGNYLTDRTLELQSVYQPKTGSWRTVINPELAGMLLGGLNDGIMSDKLSVSTAVRNYVDDYISLLKGETVKKKNPYTLSYSATVGPEPAVSKYLRFSPDQADQVLNIVAYARSCGLLEGQDVLFNPDADFYPDDIICYCDDSILVICWKEYIYGSVCNCMEVKIADGSQIKRKITSDTYNSGILDYMSNMSAAVNAVAAVNGDYYAYRYFGTTVYQGQLYRYDQSCETLMIDDKGHFIFHYPDGRSAEEMQAFIDENNIQFGMSFGPVLVDNYTPRYYTYGYGWGIGQMEDRFTRAAFGEYDDLHYLYMSSGYAVNAVPPASLDAFIDIILTKNLKNVYNLDGGQTAEIVIQNMPYNQIDYRAERPMSDMVFFATAIPEDLNE